MINPCMAKIVATQNRLFSNNLISTTVLPYLISGIQQRETRKLMRHKNISEWQERLLAIYTTLGTNGQLLYIEKQAD